MIGWCHLRCHHWLPPRFTAVTLQSVKAAQMQQPDSAAGAPRPGSGARHLLFASSPDAGTHASAGTAGGGAAGAHWGWGSNAARAQGLLEGYGGGPSSTSSHSRRRLGEEEGEGAGDGAPGPGDGGASARRRLQSRGCSSPGATLVWTDPCDPSKSGMITTAPYVYK